MTENEKNHRFMWQELAKTGGRDKKIPINKYDMPHAGSTCCYACIEVDEHNPDNCDYCPIKWSELPRENGSCPCLHTDSLYYKWVTIAEGNFQKKQFAKAISEMKWKG